MTSEGSSITQLSVATDQQSTNSGANVPGSTSATPATPVTSPPRSTAVRIMALGDSLTAGDDPSNPAKAQSYRGYLESSLQAAGYKVDFVGSMKQPAIGGNDPDHEGHGGFSIGPDNAKLCAKDQTCPPANLDSGLAGWLKEADPDVVVLLAGVNDLFDEDGGVYRPTVPEQADDKLKALVARIRALQPDARIVVGSYPPISFLITGSDEKVFADLNAAAKSAGSGTDKQVVYAPLREKLDGNWTDADVVSTSDQVHPRDTGAKKIAAVFYEAMVPVLDALGR
ncbi:MAG: SGNH/GDSL hydrolase family protein [Acidimicrobiales bacterium]